MMQKNIKWLKSHFGAPLFVFVILPWLVLSIYIGLIKTPQYESTSSIMLQHRVPQAASNHSRLQVLLKRSAQMAVNAQSASVLLMQKYIYSEQMLHKLQQEMDLKSYYQSSSIDRWSRLKQNPNQKEFLNYYLKMVRVVSDPVTGELTLFVRAFAPDKAKQILTLIERYALQYVQQTMETSSVAQLAQATAYLETARNTVMHAQQELNELQHHKDIANVATLEAKQLAAKFAHTEYDAAQQAYVTWRLASYHHTPVITAPATEPDYYISPHLPNDLISLFLMLMVLYGFGKMIVVIIREHSV